MTFERKITQTLLWLRVASISRGLARGLVPAAVVFGVTAVASKLAFPGLQWPVMAAICAAVVIIVALWHYVRTPLSPARAALAVDDHYQLKERFVSALHALRSEHQFRDVIIADAERFAPKVAPSKIPQFDVQRPLTTAGVIFAAGLFAMYLLPEMDLLGRRQQAQRKAVVKQVVAAETKKLDDIKKMLQPKEGQKPLTPAAEKAVKDIEQLQKNLANMRAPDARDAMAQLSSLADKIDKEKEAMKRQTKAGVKPQMPGAKDPASPTRRLERALKSGNMQEARAELDRMQKQAASGGMTGDEKQKSAESMKNLAERMEGDSEMKGALSQAASAMASGNMAAASKAMADAKSQADKLQLQQEEIGKLEAALNEIDEAKKNLASADAGKTMASSSEECGSCSGGGCKACEGTGKKSGTGKGEGKEGQGEGKEGKSGSSGKSGEACKSCSGAGCSSCEGGGGGEAAEMAEAEASASSSNGGATSGGGSGSGSSGSSGGGRDWGVGTTNMDAGQGGVVQAKSGENRFAAGRDSNWQEEFVKLYDPRKIDTKQYTVQAKGKMGEGEYAYSVDIEGQAQPEKPKVDTTQAFADYREAQKDSLSKEDIPVGYKEAVKSYFDSISPEDAQAPAK